jgi:septum formation topological specificity factor MinE
MKDERVINWCKTHPESAAYYINKHLSRRELLEQLAEESAELAQAALKLCRALEDAHNRTETTQREAVENMAEELVDVLNAYTAVFGDWEAVEKAVEQSKRSPKWGRWVDRLE